MKALIIALSIGVVFPTSSVLLQEQPQPEQPHTSDPAKCVKYCYPHGGDPGMKPKGVPAEAEGYECQGVKCARTFNEGDGTEDLCSEHGNEDGSGRCSAWCAKVCCSCLASCI